MLNHSLAYRGPTPAWLSSIYVSCRHIFYATTAPLQVLNVGRCRHTTTQSVVGIVRCRECNEARRGGVDLHVTDRSFTEQGRLYGVLYTYLRRFEVVS